MLFSDVPSSKVKTQFYKNQYLFWIPLARLSQFSSQSFTLSVVLFFIYKK